MLSYHDSKNSSCDTSAVHTADNWANQVMCLCFSLMVADPVTRKETLVS